MSMKCRGYYRFQGDDLCQRLVGFYKEKVEQETVECDENTLPDRKRTLVYEWLDLTPLLGKKWEGKMELAGMRRDETIGDLVNYYRPAKVSLLLNTPPVLKDGELAFHASTKWEPPVEALQILSELYPSSHIELSYSTESYCWSDGTKLRFYQGERTLVEYDSFLLAEQGQPVHHWLVDGPPEAMAALREAEICLLQPSTGYLHTCNDTSYGYKVPDGAIDKVKAIPGLECTPYTLDEASFLRKFEYYPGECAPAHIVASYVKLLERQQVSLTQEEIAIVKRKTEQANEEAERRFLAEKPHLVSDEDKEWAARACHVAGHHELARYEFHPTAREIRLLLPLSSPERRKELENALADPAWRREWPEWEKVELGKAEGA